MEGADFEGARLKGVNLKGTHLESALNLTVEQVKDAEAWEQAHYDPAFRIQLELPFS